MATLNTHPAGWQFIEQQIASASATLDFVLPAGYEEFALHLYTIRPATNDSALFGRVSNDGGSTFLTSTIYKFVNTQTDSAANSNTEVSQGSTRFSFGEFTAINAAVGNDSGLSEGISGVINIMEPLKTSIRTRARAQLVYTSAANNDNIVNFGAQVEVAETHDAFQIFFESGNIASGSACLFGLRIP